MFLIKACWRFSKNDSAAKHLFLFETFFRVTGSTRLRAEQNMFVWFSIQSTRFLQMSLTRSVCGASLLRNMWFYSFLSVPGFENTWSGWTTRNLQSLLVLGFCCLILVWVCMIVAMHWRRRLFPKRPGIMADTSDIHLFLFARDPLTRSRRLQFSKNIKKMPLNINLMILQLGPIPDKFNVPFNWGSQLCQPHLRDNTKVESETGVLYLLFSFLERWCMFAKLQNCEWKYMLAGTHSAWRLRHQIVISVWFKNREPQRLICEKQK